MEETAVLKKILALLIGIFPIRIVRIFLWNFFLGYKIDYYAQIGWGNILCCNHAEIQKAKIGNFNRIYTNDLHLENGAEIRRLNLIKLVNSFVMLENSQIVSKNSIVGLFRLNYQKRENCNFILGKDSLVTIANSIDVTDSVTIGNNVVFGGKDTQLWTHGFDVKRNMVTGPIVVGDDVYVGSRCTICQGVTIADNTVIGAATCVPTSIKEPGFYVSNQLVKKGEIKIYEN